MIANVGEVTSIQPGEQPRYSPTAYESPLVGDDPTKQTQHSPDEPDARSLLQ